MRTILTSILFFLVITVLTNAVVPSVTLWYFDKNHIAVSFRPDAPSPYQAGGYGSVFVMVDEVHQVRLTRFDSEPDLAHDYYSQGQWCEGLPYGEHQVTRIGLETDDWYSPDDSSVRIDVPNRVTCGTYHIYFPISFKEEAQ